MGFSEEDSIFPRMGGVVVKNPSNPGRLFFVSIASKELSLKMIEGCFTTPLEHTPKRLPTGYKGIPFIVG